MRAAVNERLEGSELLGMARSLARGMRTHVGPYYVRIVGWRVLARSDATRDGQRVCFWLGTADG